MNIRCAILGLLSWKPSTGYDLKKIFEESSILYWSGNNNQIYRTLIQLHNDGLVDSQVQHQESSPSRKVYSITDKGQAELRQWILSTPEAPEFKKSFLIQLAWADRLSKEELDGLLSKYEEEIKIQLALQQEKRKRGIYVPNRTPRETYIWDMIFENIISSYRNELAWIGKIRRELQEKGF